MNKDETTEAFMTIFYRMYLHVPGQSVAECHRNTKEIFERQGIENVPCLSHVRRAIKRLPKNVVTRARGIA
jgi:hypothetical protein